MTPFKVKDWSHRDRMPVMVKILGKRRLLLIFDDGLAFLDNPEDVKETGINCGLSLHEWFDKKLLARIKA